MKRRYVSSSSVKTVGYDRATRTLEIEFARGVYRYLDVPADVYDELLAAPSIGAYVNTRIKPNYEYVEVSRTRRPPRWPWRSGEART
jgi:KTSC domain